MIGSDAEGGVLFTSFHWITTTL